MANPQHVAKLKQGVQAWNDWRKQHPEITPDLYQANLSRADLKEVDLGRANLVGADLTGADLRRAELWGADLRTVRLDEATLAGANLHKADLSSAHLNGADLSRVDFGEAYLDQAELNHANLEGAQLRGAYLRHAYINGANLQDANLNDAHLWSASLEGSQARKASFCWADLSQVNLSGANLSEANLDGANLNQAVLASALLQGAYMEGVDLYKANLRQANLSGAVLRGVSLVETDLSGADLTGCSVYGLSVWNVSLEGAKQSNLLITRPDEDPLQVDDLEVAQFIYLLLNNQNVRQVIDTITSKVVLILGRFTPERKVVLDAIRSALRKWGRTPVLFDFEKPRSQTTLETISTLAHMSRFVIADLTDAKSVLQELMVIVPLNPSVMVQPILLASQKEPGMFDFFRRYPWVLDVVPYTDQDELIAVLDEKVIRPAEARALPAKSQLTNP